MIAAMAAERTIGTGTGIPWNLPRDRAHFRSYTAGKTMLLGRTTFEEMVGWFTGHRPIVLTNNQGYHHPDAAATAGSVAEAIKKTVEFGEPELVVSGGASVYTAALPYADEIILTEIDLSISGGAKFPELTLDKWAVTSRKHFPSDEENTHAMTIVRYNILSH